MNRDLSRSSVKGNSKPPVGRKVGNELRNSKENIRVHKNNFVNNSQSNNESRENSAEPRKSIDGKRLSFGGKGLPTNTN